MSPKAWEVFRTTSLELIKARKGPNQITEWTARGVSRLTPQERGWVVESLRKMGYIVDRCAGLGFAPLLGNGDDDPIFRITWPHAPAVNVEALRERRRKARYNDRVTALKTIVQELNNDQDSTDFECIVPADAVGFVRESLEAMGFVTIMHELENDMKNVHLQIHPERESE